MQSQKKPDREKAKSKRYHKPRTVEELTRQNVETIIRLEEATKAKQSRFDHIADGVTRVCGSMLFVVFHVIWYVTWMVANVGLPAAQRWDPFPFPFLTLTVSLEAIFLSVFILISQNRQSALSERRAQLDLQVNLLSEQENTKMLELLGKIGEKLGVDVRHDPRCKCWRKPLDRRSFCNRSIRRWRSPGRAEPLPGLISRLSADAELIPHCSDCAVAKIDFQQFLTHGSCSGFVL